MTALGTTSANYRPATTGFHANQKAMGALATNNGRLISAFHFSNTDAFRETGNYTGLKPSCQRVFFPHPVDKAVGNR
jgi:hypothetical protein